MFFIDDEDDDVLFHYGTPQLYPGSPRGSGRYRKGSGEEPFQHDRTFLDSYRELKKQGLSEVEIARFMGMSTTELRQKKAQEKDALKQQEYEYAKKLKDKGYSNVAIGERIGRGDTYVAHLLNPEEHERAIQTEQTKNLLQDSVDEFRYIDIGPGAESMLGVSRDRLGKAVARLEDEGYKVQYLKIPQAGIPGQFTTVKVLVAPDVPYQELWENRDAIGFPLEQNTNIAKLREDRGNDDITALGIRPPVSVDPSRIKINYAEDGGKEKDGVIELRRDAPDLSLGNSHYAQVRIAVDDSHYLKGMAVYGDDMPEGIDIIFNTNKSKDVPMLGPKNNTVLKPLKDDKDNPFGATLEMEDGVIIGQYNYIDKDGKEKQSPINIVRSEGSWDTWSSTLASQFLSKQPKALIKQQLTKSYNDKEEEFIDIQKLTNPEVKKYMLEQFADDCDSSAVHLKAAALPRQSSKVILPLIDISDKEVYAPTYKDGEQVVLIRYPHGGTFEIPTLTVNNKNKSGRRILGEQAVDAIGINSKVAERLSGADFDGDSVVVIPLSSTGQKIKTTPPLRDLDGFDPKTQYGPKSYSGKSVKLMTKSQTQTEMGKISNLITDMTLKGAKEEELARAVKHSMVVIDAEKHKLNYQQSELDNDIKSLKTKYQGGPNKGASTLISQAKAKDYRPIQKEKYGTVRTDDEEKIFKDLSKRVFSSLSSDEQKQFTTLNKKLSKEEAVEWRNGKKIYYETGETVEKNGTSRVRTENRPRMARTDDAYTLSSGTYQENLYADYANKLKSLGNEARKVLRSTPSQKYSPSARETYSEEVKSLDAKLKVAKANKPLERKAQIYANVIIKNKLEANPGIEADEIKKLKTQALASARAQVGANKSNAAVKITDKEWEAIQAGAISSTKLNEILQNTNMDRVKQLATPRESKVLSDSQQSRIQNLKSQGRTISEIADTLGVSTSTVSKYLD